MATPDYSFKYIIIGDCSVGKSCLLLQYTDQRFKLTHDLTIGVEFGTKIVSVPGALIKLHIWDTAGSESFRSLTKGYYRGSAGAFVVYDVTNRQSFTNVTTWVEELTQSVSSQTVICLVGNKTDLAEARQVTREEGETLAKAKGMAFVEVSAKTGENVDACFDGLTQELYSKIQNGEIDITNETTGVKILKPSPGRGATPNGCYC